MDFLIWLGRLLRRRETRWILLLSMTLLVASCGKGISGSYTGPNIPLPGGRSLAEGDQVTLDFRSNGVVLIRSSTGVLKQARYTVEGGMVHLLPGDGPSIDLQWEGSTLSAAGGGIRLFLQPRSKFLTVWFDCVHDWGYLGIIFLMAMESSIVPVPSEIVIPPAAYWAAHGQLNFWGVIAAGTFGSWLGAAITYWVSLYLGRAVILQYGRYFLISEEKLLRAERWVHRYEAGGILFARLLPVIRHLISIPAGVIRMPFRRFSLMTLVGSAIWCAVLAFFGKEIIDPQLIQHPEELVLYLKQKSLWVACFVALVGSLYFVALWLTAPKEGEKA